MPSAGRVMYNERKRSLTANKIRSDYRAADAIQNDGRKQDEDQFYLDSNYIIYIVNLLGKSRGNVGDFPEKCLKGK